MKKRDLLFSGLMLMALPLAAQVEPVEAPQFNPQTDPEVLFVQDFEADFDAWSAKEIDTINGVWYYKTATGTNTSWNPYDKSDEGTQIYAWRDTLIHMYNGVVQTDDKNDLAQDAFNLDRYTIVEDIDDTRKEAFRRFGEDGGNHFFRYIADHKTGNTGNAYTNGVVAEYRRNLFVRGLPVTPETSYRLTIYLKGVSTAKTTVPTFSADVMRGYFHSEKPFSMGLTDAASSYQYNRTFAYTLENGFTGEWQKITFMTYYLNDSIAERFMHNQYYWDDWKWAAKPGEDSVIRIKQPDKFFVRLAFRSDSTTFEVDNISLTKSWIGGIQHYKDKLRVDFGYQTNLKNLAAAAKASTGIGAVELPGNYFEVIGRLAGEQDWYKVEILSAEYHDDGYMYMWAKPMEEGGDEIPVYFDEYFDSVLVSFTNPDDQALRLNYNGNYFPMALDTNWIKEGKKVPNFYHEPSSPNPFVFNGVYSMKDLPPVMKVAQYEENSFNLSGTLSSMDFTFSRGVVYDQNATEATQHAAMQVSKGGYMETWFITGEKKGEDKDMTYTFTRPAGLEPLDGDYEFKLINIHDKTTDKAQPTVMHYSFGTSDVEPQTLASVDFLDMEVGSAFTTSFDNFPGFGNNGSGRMAIKVAQFGGLYEKALMFGIYGTNFSNGAPELSYTFEIETPGTYDLAFGTSGCLKNSWNDGCKMEVTLYDADGNKLGSYTEEGTSTKPEEGKAVTAIDENAITATFAVAGTYKVVFKLPNENSYGGGHKGGRVLYYISVTTPTKAGYSYIKKYRSALGALNATLAKAESDREKYAGAVYDSYKLIANQYANFVDTKPSRYNAVTDSLNKANTAVLARYDVVDAFWKAYSDAVDKLSQYDDDAIADAIEYSELDTYQAYDALITEYENYVCYTKTDDEIKADQKIIEDAGKALDARKELMTAFTNAQKYVKGLIDDSTYIELPQYQVMIAAFEESKAAAQAITTMIDDDLKSATNDLLDAGHDYAWYMPMKSAQTARLNALAATATALNVDFGSHKADVEKSLADAVTDDPALVDIYKSAIKLEILKLFKDANLAGDTIDMTGFITNFNLYTTAAAAANFNDDMQYYNYQWGEPHDRWKTKNNHESKTVYPGWTYKSTSGNAHVGNEATNWREALAPAFDAYLALDWGTAVTMSQSVADLPAGIYSLGLGMRVSDDAGNNKSSIAATVAAGQKKVFAPKTDGSIPTEANIWIDSLAVNGAEEVAISLNMASYNSWSRVDNWALKLIGKDETFDYAGAIATTQSTLEELLNYVDAAAAQKVSVEFYGLDGMKRESIKSGEVIIKVSTSANGRRTVEKVLVK